MTYLPKMQDKLNLRVISKSVYHQLKKYSPISPLVYVNHMGTAQSEFNFRFYPTVDLLVDEVGPSITSLRVDVGLALFSPYLVVGL